MQALIDLATEEVLADHRNRCLRSKAICQHDDGKLQALPLPKTSDFDSLFDTSGSSFNLAMATGASKIMVIHTGQLDGKDLVLVLVRHPVRNAIAVFLVQGESGDPIRDLALVTSFGHFDLWRPTGWTGRVCEAKVIKVAAR